MALERMTVIIVTAAALGGVAIGLFASNFAGEVKRQGEAYTDGHQEELIQEVTRPIQTPDEKRTPLPEEVTTKRLRLIMQAMDLYMLEHHNQHPENLEDLVMSGILTAETLVDGWGRLFHYHINTKTQQVFVHSLGKDPSNPADDIPQLPTEKPAEPAVELPAQQP